MILATGGLGMTGAHTARALVDLWLDGQGRDELAEPFTFAVSANGGLLLAPRRGPAPVASHKRCKCRAWVPFHGVILGLVFRTYRGCITASTRIGKFKVIFPTCAGRGSPAATW
jgi:hypothetical protein